MTGTVEYHVDSRVITRDRGEIGYVLSQAEFGGRVFYAGRYKRSWETIESLKESLAFEIQREIRMVVQS